MKKITLFCILCLVLPLISYAQTEVNIDSLIIQGKQQLNQAENTWKETDLLQARAYFERLLTNPSKVWLVHYYLGLADSRLVSYYFSIQNKDKAKLFIDDGIEHLQHCVETKEDFADVHSLLSSLYGNKIGVNPFSAMTLGPKSGKEMEKAMFIEPKNPRNYLIAGWSAYFTPRLFGGGKDKAEKYFKQAITYFDSSKVTDPLLPDWGHDEAYAWLGLVQMGNKEFEAAKSNFTKALEINPDYNWVNYVLMPDLNKKMASNK